MTLDDHRTGIRTFMIGTVTARIAFACSSKALDYKRITTAENRSLVQQVNDGSFDDFEPHNRQ